MADEKVVTTPDLGLEKKKKKKSKKLELEVESINDSIGELNLEGKKKKKKKKVKDDEDDGEGVAAPELDLGKKKKKSKKDKDKASTKGDKSENSDLPNLSLPQRKPNIKPKKMVGSNDRKMGELDPEQMANFQYDDLLIRVCDRMDQMGVGKGGKSGKKFVCKPPSMNRIGTKRTSFSNFAEILRDFNRPERHVMQYLLAELGTSGNLDGTKSLIIKGKFKPSQMESILRQYIREYIICQTCKSSNTMMDKIERLYFLLCNDCSSRRTVQPLKVGFSAVVGKRKKLREKTEAAASASGTKVATLVKK